jgi:hypothetical protein
VLASLPGTATQGCVDVKSLRDVRSGGIAVGNFSDARKQFRSLAKTHEQPEVAFYVIPRDANAKNVKVSLTAPGHTTPTRTVTSANVQQAEEWNYFMLTVPIPSPGGWQVTAVAGKDRGCFDVKFDR